jgi:hypothetical protein
MSVRGIKHGRLMTPVSFIAESEAMSASATETVDKKQSRTGTRKRRTPPETLAAAESR